MSDDARFAATPRSNEVGAGSEPTELSRLADELRELKRNNRYLGARNAKLAELLKSSRDKLSALYSQVEELSEPPSTYGIFLERSTDPACAEISAHGRRMRVAISPMLCQADLKPGVQVRLGTGNQIVEATGFDTTGVLGTVVDTLAPDRAIIADQVGEQRVVQLAGPLLERTTQKPKVGDALTYDPRSGYAFELIPRNEVATLSLEEIPDVTYSDIGGLNTQIEQIHDAVELPFSHPELYRSYNLRPPKGVLLYGPPGCGKTLIAKAVANSLARRTAEDRHCSGPAVSPYFLNIKGPELLNKFVGESERQIRVIFERARELAGTGCPVIVFFDEMESIFRTRGSGRSSDVETTVVPQLLTELDGVEQLDNVIVIGATNREELIDPAILRPGRLDVKIRVARPNREAATDIFARYLRGDTPLAAPANDLIETAVEELFTPRPYVELTFSDGTTTVLNYSDFVSGAMIANIVDRAKKSAIKDHLAGVSCDGVSTEHLVDAVRTEQRETEDLPNTTNPDEWTRIVGRQGKKVVEIRSV